LKPTRVSFALRPHLAGELHDIGKYTHAFQARLSGSPTPVDHSTNRPDIVMKLRAGGCDRVACELIAHAIAGHHTGLMDCQANGTTPTTTPLNDRLVTRAKSGPLDPVWRSAVQLQHAGVLPNFAWSNDPCVLPFQLALSGRCFSRAWSTPTSRTPRLSTHALAASKSTANGSPCRRSCLISRAATAGTCARFPAMRRPSTRCGQVLKAGEAASRWLLPTPQLPEDSNRSGEFPRGASIHSQNLTLQPLHLDCEALLFIL